MASNDSGRIVTTGQYLDRKVLTWKIENFEQIRRSKELIYSQRIKIDLGHNANFPTEWICKLKLKSEEDSEKEMQHVGVFVLPKKVPAGCKDVIVSFELRINKSNYHNQFVRNFMKDETILTKSFGFAKVVKADKKPETVLDNGCLLLELDLKLFPASQSEKQVAITATEVENQYGSIFSEKLRQDLMTLVAVPMKNVDMKIVSKDGIEINVIAAILSARSPVFKKMFQADIEESKSGIVNIPDLCSETILLILQFIYTGTLPAEWKSSSVLPELLYAAGKYHLPDLLSFLDDIVGKVCTNDNAAKLIEQAQKLGMKQAEKELIEFMRTNMSSLDESISFAEDCTVSNLLANWLG